MIKINFFIFLSLIITFFTSCGHLQEYYSVENHVQYNGPTVWGYDYTMVGFFKDAQGNHIKSKTDFLIYETEIIGSIGKMVLGNLTPWGAARYTFADSKYPDDYIYRDYWGLTGSPNPLPTGQDPLTQLNIVHKSLDNSIKYLDITVDYNAGGTSWK